ncbi:hypothetical protein KUTeg_012467 [Tegillarca granosa]|uniref:4'-phosphopantetheine phosphatase n=1 Tax=Tegillarca granosa TaxID=220873 RepID=A0ABQ9F3Y0_TEGGR|nr:hypothetical protein KUTeg_012467 [Tegillarca granosa]
MTDGSYAKSIELPNEEVFRNLKNAHHFAIDIGGSLAKVAYSSRIQRRTSMVLDEPNKTKLIEKCLDFIHNIWQRDGQQKTVDREDEMGCLIKGCNFLLKNIPDESFIYQRHGSPEYKFHGVDYNIFPYLLVNIGSGVSLIKTFDELLTLAENGDHREVDMLVKDIYGGAYSSIGLTGDIIAKEFKDEDIAKSLLLSISNDVGQIAYLHAKLHGIKKIYFGGFFIRGHPMTMHTISYAVNFWSKGEIQPLFLRHEGYLGAIGAFLKGAEEDDTENFTWGENFAGSSGLGSSQSNFFRYGRQRSSTFDMLELDKLDKPLQKCPLLLDPNSYLPDTVDLNEDDDARQYWLDCFANSVDKTKQQAIRSQSQSKDVEERAENFKAKYLTRLKELKENPCLLDTSSHCLQDFLFTDPYSLFLDDLDKLSWDDRQLALVKGLLAGNVFDWGAREVANIMENTEPWLFDEFDKWKERLSGNKPPHNCAVIFCDNSGYDIILGVFPFVRELLNRGSNACYMLIDHDLVEAIAREKADLIVIEGMGRAVHTNFNAAFSCEALKVAVIKNRWLANRLGGEMFSVMFKYEPPKMIKTS